MNILKSAIEAIQNFQTMTLEEFLELSPQDRGFIGGCIIGNYSAHHPVDAFALLKTIKPKINNS